MSKRAVVLAVALAAWGCGGHKKTAAPPVKTPAPTETATASKAAAGCTQLLMLRNQVEQALLAGKVDPRMPRSLEPQARKAPREIRADALKIAAAYRQVRRELGQGTPPTQVLNELNTMPGLTAATERINRWAAANCLGSG
jgi:hypothetical protein